MRQYYASDRKKREEAKKRKKEEKRLRKLSRDAAKSEGAETPESGPQDNLTDSQD